METVISIDNRLGKTANVYDEHLSCLKNNKKKEIERNEQEMIS